MFGFDFYKKSQDFLVKLINDIINSLYGFANTYVDPLTVAGVADKYDFSMFVGKRLIAIAFFYAIVGMFISSDISSTKKFSTIIRDVAFSLGLFLAVKYVIGYMHQIFNLIGLGWISAASDDLAAIILQASGISIQNPAATLSGSAALSLLVLGLVNLLAIVVLLIEQGIFQGLFNISIVVLPLFIGIYALDVGRGFFQKFINFYFGLLLIGPIQNLAISLLFSSTGQFTFRALSTSIGYLIIVTLLIPCGLLFGISAASNPKVIE